MRIATWNIGSLYKDINKALPFFIDVVRVNNPDIICLQEFTGDPDLQRIIKRSLNYPYFHFLPLSNNHEMEGTVCGLAVFSKTDSCFIESHFLRNPHIKYLYQGKTEETYDKAFACFSIYDNGYEYILITGHGIPFHRSNTDELLYRDIFVSLDKWVSSMIEISHRWVIASDFNTEKLNILCPGILRLGNDMINHPTRPNGRKHDYLILPHNVRVNSIVNIPGCFDHNFCMVDFDWR